MVSLQGVYDLHIHLLPDVKPRFCDDNAFAKRAYAAGMAGFVIKAHYGDTAARAALVQAQYPDLTVVGGVVLNRHVGGLNPYAVEACAQTGGRIVWMPTMDSLNYHLRKKPDMSLEEQAQYVGLFDAEGKLLPAVDKVLDMIVKYDMILATGHISPKEGLALVAAAKAKGVKKIVITHVNSPADRYTVAEQKWCVEQGCIIEQSYFAVTHNQTSLETTAAEIKAVGPTNVYISSDFGQVDAIAPELGMAEFMQRLLDYGITQAELDIMTKVNPHKLLAK